MLVKFEKKGIVIELDTFFKKDGRGSLQLTAKYTFEGKTGNIDYIGNYKGQNVIMFYVPLKFQGKEIEAIGIDDIIIDNRKLSDTLLELESTAKKIQDEGKSKFLADFKNGKINLTKKLVGSEFPEWVFAINEEEIEKTYNVISSWDIMYNYLSNYKINDISHDFYKIPMGYGEIEDGNIIFKSMIEKIETEINEKKESIEKRNSEALAKAISTNEKVLLWTTTIECNGEVDDCTFDNIGEYIYPDGHREEFHSHCF
jgi:hypothetical protein